jgi:hypothetical protein
MRKTIFLILMLALIFPMMRASSFAEGAAPLSLSYSGGTGSGRSNSDFDENKWTYEYQYHVLSLAGDLPQGKLSSQLQVEESNDVSELTYARIKLSADTYSLDLGDNVMNFSDLTLNNVAYQGAAVTLKPSSNLNLTVVSGARGSGSWGAAVLRDTRPKDYFTGVRGMFSTGAGLGLSATYLTNPEGDDVTSVGGEFDLGNLEFAAESGTAKDGNAVTESVKYKDGLLTLGTVYRDIDPTYTVPVDYINFKGIKGTYTTLGFSPSSNFSVNLQNNSYIDRLNGTPDGMNVETSGDINCYLDSGTNIGYSGWRNDRRAYDRGGITEGEVMYITQQFWLLTRNSIYYRNQPAWFQSFTPSEESYSENKNVAGINISLFDLIHLNYEVENSEKIFKSTDITVNPTAISMRMDIFETQITGTPFSLASSFNYRKDIPDKYAVDPDSTAYTSAYSDATLKYAPSPDMSCFVTAKVFDLVAPDTDRTARTQNDLSFGLTCAFNTNIYMK